MTSPFEVVEVFGPLNDVGVYIDRIHPVVGMAQSRSRNAEIDYRIGRREPRGHQAEYVPLRGDETCERSY